MAILPGYEPHTWECGETITDEKMNNIEIGIMNALAKSSGVVVIRATSLSEGVATTDKTWQEIADALDNGTPCYVGFDLAICGSSDVSQINGSNMMPVIGTRVVEGTYSVHFISLVAGNAVNGEALTTTSATGYLTFDGDCSID